MFVCVSMRFCRHQAKKFCVSRQRMKNVPGFIFVFIPFIVQKRWESNEIAESGRLHHIYIYEMALRLVAIIIKYHILRFFFIRFFLFLFLFFRKTKRQNFDNK